jgi:hypothetical protein
VEACPYRTWLKIWNASSTANPLRRGRPLCPPAQGNYTDSVHRTTQVPLVFPMATRRGRPLRLPFWRFGHRRARAGEKACPYRNWLEIWNASSSTNPLRRGGPLCPPAQGNQSDIGHQIMLMLLGFPMATRRGRPLCLPFWRFASQIGAGRRQSLTTYRQRVTKKIVMSVVIPKLYALSI